MTHGPESFWTVIVFYEGGNWLAWTYAVPRLAHERLVTELAYPGAVGHLTPLEVRHG